jgi:4-amino-4-deoxy-L-arabinose transferase-like glycosyltransferase
VDGSACDFTYGFPVDLPRGGGDHRLRVRALNFSGPAGIDVRPELGTVAYLFLGCALLSVLFPLYLRQGAAGLRTLYSEGQGLRLGTVLSWRRLEHLLLALYLASRLYILWKRWGLIYGFDANPHMEMVRLMPWAFDGFPRLDGCFYCFHPPVGFWMAKALMLTGMRDSMAIQTVSALTMLLGFFSLRATVGRVGALDRPWGIAFLYFTSSLPMMTYLGSAQTSDSIMYGWSAVILYVCVRLTWSRRRDTEAPSWRTWLGWAGLVALMAIAMLSKFSGVLLLCLPLLAALLAPHRVWLHLRSAIVACVLAVALVFPYYYVRNYREQHTFFPTNTSWLRADAVRAAQAKRDENRFKFILAMLTPSAVDPDHEEVFDTKVPRLYDTWRYVWIGSDQLGPSSDSLAISRHYLVWAPWICLAGLVALVRRRRRLLLWGRAGVLFGGIAAIQVAALSKLAYDVAFAEWLYVKPVYIAPAAWFLGFLMTLPITERWWLPYVLGTRWRLGRIFSLVLIAVFLGINGWYMVY